MTDATQPLSNAQHERFAQELAQGASATDAYVAAGYAKNDSNAARLRASKDVQARVAELQRQAAEGARITLDMLIGYAQEIRRNALSATQNAAAIAAVKELGILTGLRVEKRENRNVAEMSRISDEELQAIACGAVH